jgi:ABC-type sulfate transport system substrate-binding protein
MAWTLTKTKTVMGDMRTVFIDCTADAATFNIETGLSKIFGFATGIKSLTSSDFTLVPNYKTSGTAGAGYIAATGFTSGDEMCLVVYGK